MARGRHKSDVHGKVIRRKEDFQTQQDNWVQCDRCQKWRKLPPGTVVRDKEPWFCEYNPDPNYKSCRVPEEVWKDNSAKGQSQGSGEPLGRQGRGPGRGRGRGRIPSGRGRGRGRGRSRISDSIPSTERPALNSLQTSNAPAVKRDLVSPRAEAPQFKKRKLGFGFPKDSMKTESKPSALLPSRESMQSPSGPLTPGAAAAAAKSRNMAYRFPSIGSELLELINSCHRIMANSGTWVPVPMGQAPQYSHFTIPSWLWHGFHRFAPDCTAVAADALDVLSAAQLCAVANPQHQQQQADLANALLYARLTMLTLATLALPAAETAKGEMAKGAVRQLLNLTKLETPSTANASTKAEPPSLPQSPTPKKASLLDLSRTPEGQPTSALTSISQLVAHIQQKNLAQSAPAKAGALGSKPPLSAGPSSVPKLGSPKEHPSSAPSRLRSIALAAPQPGKPTTTQAPSNSAKPTLNLGSPGRGRPSTKNAALNSLKSITNTKSGITPASPSGQVKAKVGEGPLISKAAGPLQRPKDQQHAALEVPQLPPVQLSHAPVVAIDLSGNISPSSSLPSLSRVISTAVLPKWSKHPSEVLSASTSSTSMLTSQLPILTPLTLPAVQPSVSSSLLTPALPSPTVQPLTVTSSGSTPGYQSPAIQPPSISSSAATPLYPRPAGQPLSITSSSPNPLYLPPGVQPPLRTSSGPTPVVPSPAEQPPVSSSGPDPIFSLPAVQLPPDTLLGLAPVQPLPVAQPPVSSSEATPSDSLPVIEPLVPSSGLAPVLTITSVQSPLAPSAPTSAYSLPAVEPLVPPSGPAPVLTMTDVQPPVSSLAPTPSFSVPAVHALVPSSAPIPLDSLQAVQLPPVHPLTTVQPLLSSSAPLPVEALPVVEPPPSYPLPPVQRPVPPTSDTLEVPLPLEVPLMPHSLP